MVYWIAIRFVPLGVANLPPEKALYQNMFRKWFSSVKKSFSEQEGENLDIESWDGCLLEALCI